MKVKKSELKTVNVAYLHSDGHLVLVHEKRDRDAGTVNWVTIYQDIGIRTYFEGRLIIGKGALPFVLHATKIEAREPTTKGGSQNTRDKGIAVGSVSLYNGTDYGFHINLMPGLISNDFTYQPETVEKFEDSEGKYHWGLHNIKNRYKAV